MVAAGTAQPVTPTAPASPADGPRGRRPATRAIVLVALAFAALGAIAMIVVSAVGISAAEDRDERRTQILAAARQHAVNFTTLDYQHLDRDLGRVLDGATGQFREQFKSGSADLSELVTQNEAVSSGEVLEAGIVTDDADSARVLVVADSTVTNTASTEPQKRHYRMQLDLVLQGGRWLVSDLQFVG